MVVAPTSAVAGSAGNTLTFKYTAAAGGLNNGDDENWVDYGFASDGSGGDGDIKLK